MKKKIVLLTVFALVAILVAGGTMAWFTSKASADNHFTAGTVKIEIDEHGFEDITNVNPGDCYDKIVSFKSTGSKKTYLRVKLTPYWDNGTEGTLPASYAVLENNVVTIKGEGHWEWQSSGGCWGWIFGKWVWIPGEDTTEEEPIWIYDDGYYYYVHILEGGETENIIEQVCFDGKTMGDEFQGSTFRLTVEAEAIQASNGAADDLWGGLPEGVEPWVPAE